MRSMSPLSAVAALAACLLLLGAGPSFARPAMPSPAFEVRSVAGATLAVPSGWQVKQSAQPVPTIQIEETAGAADSPSVTLMTVPLQGNPQTLNIFAQQLLQSAMPSRQQTGHQPGADGSLMTEWAGAIGGIPAKMTLIQRVDPARGIGVLAVFAAPTARYAELGGHMLLLRVLSGQAGGAGAGGQKPVARPAGAPSGRLQIPAAYAASKKPTLDYIVDKLEGLTPAQVALGLRQLNPTEVQLLGIYGAFANLLHLIACRADGSLMLPTGASCAQTLAGWQQTLQFLNNDWDQATVQARQERTRLQIATRCSDGRHDQATCATYTKTVGDMNRANHETMMQIIRNMDPYACTVGEAGCVPR